MFKRCKNFPVAITMVLIYRDKSIFKINYMYIFYIYNFTLFHEKKNLDQLNYNIDANVF